jgi:uncharacterized lipoprotein YehR (DUF1307 family)
MMKTFLSKEIAKMKLLYVCLACSLALVGCGGKQANVSTNNSVTTTEVREVEKPRTESTSPTPMASPVTKTSGPPVEVTYLGVAPGKESVSYKIKINTGEPISQVDLGVKYLDDAGKVLEETTYAWQNVVKSVRQPIEKGKTYEVKDELPEGATRAEYVLKRVIFQNGIRWNVE